MRREKRGTSNEAVEVGRASEPASREASDEGRGTGNEAAKDGRASEPASQSVSDEGRGTRNEGALDGRASVPASQSVSDEARGTSNEAVEVGRASVPASREATEEGQGTSDEAAKDGRVTAAPSLKNAEEVLAWLMDRGLQALSKEANPVARGPVRTFENPPEDLFEPFEYTGKPDGFERILVQVTEDDLKLGVNKVARLRQDGWVVEKSFIDGAFLRMKRPSAAVEAERSRRQAEYESWLKPKKIAAPSDAKDSSGKALGTAVNESVSLSSEVFTTDEVMEMSRTGRVPAATD